MDRAMAHHQHHRTSERDEFEQKVSTKWPMYQLKDVDFPATWRVSLESYADLFGFLGAGDISLASSGAGDISLASLGQMTSVCSCHTGQHQPLVAGPRRRFKRFSCRGEAWENWPQSSQPNSVQSQDRALWSVGMGQFSAQCYHTWSKLQMESIADHLLWK